MVEFYARMVVTRKRTLEQVPERWRQEVAELLAA